MNSWLVTCPRDGLYLTVLANSEKKKLMSLVIIMLLPQKESFPAIPAMFTNPTGVNITPTLSPHTPRGRFRIFGNFGIPFT